MRRGRKNKQGKDKWRPKKGRAYKKLPGSKWVAGLATRSRATLWLGDDHVLQLMSQGYSESYRRFFFRDLQAIVLTRTPRYLVYNLLFGIAALGFGVAAPFWAPWLCGICAGLAGVGLLANLVRGPTCVCRFQTAVQSEKIHSLGYLRIAEKVVGILAPRVRQAQADLGPESEESAQGAPPTATVLPDVAGRQVPRAVSTGSEAGPVPPGRLRWQLALSATLFLHGALTILLTSVFPGAMFVGMGLATLVTLLSALGLLISAYRSAPRGKLSWFGWLGMGYCGIVFLFAWILQLVLIMSHPLKASNTYDLFQLAQEMAVEGARGITVFALGMATLALGMGIWGLLVWRREERVRSGITQPSAPPPLPVRPRSVEAPPPSAADGAQFVAVEE